jgi:hypothetical protein
MVCQDAGCANALEFSAISSQLHIYHKHIAELCIKDYLDEKWLHVLSRALISCEPGTRGALKSLFQRFRNSEIEIDCRPFGTEPTLRGPVISSANPTRSI